MLYISILFDNCRWPSPDGSGYPPMDKNKGFVRSFLPIGDNSEQLEKASKNVPNIRNLKIKILTFVVMISSTPFGLASGESYID